MKTNHCSEIHNYLNHKTSTLSPLSLKHHFFHSPMLSILFFISFMFFFYFLFLSFISLTIFHWIFLFWLVWPHLPLLYSVYLPHPISHNSLTQCPLFSHSFSFSFYPFHIPFVCLEKCLFWLQQCTMAWWEIIVRKQNSFLIFISFSHFPK